MEQAYIPRFPTLPASHQNNDIGDAIGNFADAIKQVQVSRSLNSATEELQTLKQQEASDSQIKQRQSELSQQLGQQMISLGGFPVSQIQSAMGVISPTQERYNTPTELLAYAPEAVRQRYIEGQQQLKPPKEPDAVAQEMRLSRKEREDEKAKNDVLDKTQKRIDSATLSSRSLLGNLENKGAKIQELNGILGARDPEAYKKLANIQINELATTFNSALTNGVGSEGGREALVPRTWSSDMAKLRQYANNKPTGTDQADFVGLYADMIDRTQSIIGAQSKAMKINSIKARPGNFEKYEADMAPMVKNLINEDAHFEKGKGVVFEGDAEREKIGNKLKLLSSPGKISSPQDAAFAATKLKEIEDDPNYWQTILVDKSLSARVQAIRGSLRRFQNPGSSY